MDFDKDGIKLLKLGYKLYSNVYKSLFLLQIIVLSIIAFFSEIPEIVPFGYEVGFFLFPISSSILVGFFIHFLTSHLDSVKNYINSYRNLDLYFEGLRRAVRNVFLSLSEDKELAIKINFYSSNIENCLKIEVLDNPNYDLKVKAYDGLNLWHDSTKKDVFIQFFNDLNNRYNFDSLGIDPLIKRRYLDVITVLENNIMPMYKNKEFAILNFYSVLKPSITILAEANKLLSKDYLFKESMLWYQNPPELSKNRNDQLTIRL